MTTERASTSWRAKCLLPSTEENIMGVLVQERTKHYKPAEARDILGKTPQDTGQQTISVRSVLKVGLKGVFHMAPPAGPIWRRQQEGNQMRAGEAGTPELPV